MKNHAFTLIELLVVVLIIGILTAIALPQYQKAVEKSRFVQLQIAGKALDNAEQLYYLANGDYTADLTQLDIQMPGNIKDSLVTFGDYKCHLNINGIIKEVTCYRKDVYTGGAVPLWLKPMKGKSVRCRAFNDKQRQVCQKR